MEQDKAEINSSKLLKTRYGVLAVPVNDEVIARSLEIYGEWAQDEVDLIKDLASAFEGDIVDVGANIGTHSVAFASPPHARNVVAFEMQPYIAELLETNARSNNLGHRIKIESVGLADFSDSREMRFPHQSAHTNFGGVGIKSKPSTEESETHQIKFDLLDNFNLLSCGILKIDAEGSEISVLNGSLQMISRFSPALFCEANDFQAAIDLWKWGNQHQYKSYLFFSRPFRPENFNSASKDICGFRLMAATQFGSMPAGDFGCMTATRFGSIPATYFGS